MSTLSGQKGLWQFGVRPELATKADAEEQALQTSDPIWFTKDGCFLRNRCSWRDPIFDVMT